MSQHVLIVPPLDGPIESTEFSYNGDLVVRAALVERGAAGVYVTFDLKVDDQPCGAIAWFAGNPMLLRNLQAEKILRFLTGAYMEILGHACFINIDPALAEAVLSGDYERTMT